MKQTGIDDFLGKMTVSCEWSLAAASPFGWPRDGVGVSSPGSNWILGDEVTPPRRLAPRVVDTDDTEPLTRGWSRYARKLGAEATKKAEKLPPLVQGQGCNTLPRAAFHP